MQTGISAWTDIHTFTITRAAANTPYFLNTARAAEAEVEYRIYAGADCSFTLYRDSGDGYAYEQGEYELTELVWEEKTKKLFVNGTEQSENVVIYS